MSNIVNMKFKETAQYNKIQSIEWNVITYDVINTLKQDTITSV